MAIIFINLLELPEIWGDRPPSPSVSATGLQPLVSLYVAALYGSFLVVYIFLAKLIRYILFAGQMGVFGKLSPIFELDACIG